MELEQLGQTCAVGCILHHPQLDAGQQMALSLSGMGGGGAVLCGDLVILSYAELSQLVIPVDTGLCSPQESQL